jgi:hypothetical protein
MQGNSDRVVLTLRSTHSPAGAPLTDSNLHSQPPHPAPHASCHVSFRIADSGMFLSRGGSTINLLQTQILTPHMPYLLCLARVHAAVL